MGCFPAALDNVCVGYFLALEAIYLNLTRLCFWDIGILFENVPLLKRLMCLHDSCPTTCKVPVVKELLREGKTFRKAHS